MEGEGLGWLKLSRVRKLMEDESYRNLVVSRMNKTLDKKVGPDDHIEDVVRTLSHYTKLLNLFSLVLKSKILLKKYLLRMVLNIR